MMPSEQPAQPDPSAPGPDSELLDRDAGPLVRPYLVTRGRAQAQVAFDLLDYVQAEVDPDDPERRLQPECVQILRYCRTPAPIADLASHLDLPLGVVRVLLGDLLHSGFISLHEPRRDADQPDEPILKAVINGLRSL